MRSKLILYAFLLNTAACSTLNDSLKLGAGVGAASGAAATYSAYSSNGSSPSFENVAIGAGIGMGLGLLTSYIVHKQVEEDRQSNQFQQTEMHFGDLPPSPFIMPKPKKGGR